MMAHKKIPALTLALALLVLSRPFATAQTTFSRGDVDGDLQIGITDVLQLVGYLFGGSPRVLRCEDAADTNDSGAINISDGVYLLSALFRAGPQPPDPYPDAGADPTEDSLRCGDDLDASVATRWFRWTLRAVQTERLSPPLASRLFGYLGVTLWESVVPGLSQSRSLVGQLNGLEALPEPEASASYHYSAVANAALAAVASGLLPTASGETMTAMAELSDALDAEFALEADAEVLERSRVLGEALGAAILAWAAADGAPEMRGCAYEPPVGEGLWVPTLPAFAPALEPCWGQVRTFTLSASDVCDPGPPPAYSTDPSSAFYAETLEVYEAVQRADPEELIIANFWADNPGQTATPPGHSVSILTQLAEERDYPLALVAEAYARVGMATADAFISCWDAKYKYNLVRPITVIREIFDPEFTTPVATPPFPEYTSGHSVQSGASAQVLTDLLGEFPFIDHTHDARGMESRQFESFFDAANEAAISRLYGGIHFRAAIDLGVDQGRCVGARISALRFRGP